MNSSRTIGVVTRPPRGREYEFPFCVIAGLSRGRAGAHVHYSPIQSVLVRSIGASYSRGHELLRMRWFDDFDAWGTAISGASLRLACNGVETRTWSIGFADLGGVLLQVASEGGGTVCYGANAHAGTILFVPLTHSGEHVVNGRPLDDASLLAIPRGADFRIHVRKLAHAWCSIALPFDHPIPSASSTEITGHPAVPRLKRLAQSIAGSLLERPGVTAAHRRAGRELAAAAVACLPAIKTVDTRVGRPRLDRGEIIRRSMELIDEADTMPTAVELAAEVGVTGRTLLRTFREQFGVPPKRYLLLRELHAVRRGLRDDGSDDATVADVLARHGIWEFGRFAGRYRRQFGEFPSETLYRARG